MFDNKEWEVYSNELDKRIASNCLAVIGALKERVKSAEEKKVVKQPEQLSLF